jgi:hypothetical protein
MTWEKHEHIFAEISSSVFVLPNTLLDFEDAQAAGNLQNIQGVPHLISSSANGQLGGLAQNSYYALMMH